MHSSAVWLIPLAVVAAGAGALAAVAARFRRDVEELQKSMRPLRVPIRGRRTQRPED